MRRIFITVIEFECFSFTGHFWTIISSNTLRANSGNQNTLDESEKKLSSSETLFGNDIFLTLKTLKKIFKCNYLYSRK